jgi:hypothetical protein
VIDVRARLTASDLPAIVTRLGFRDDDVADVLAAAASAADSDEDVSRIEVLVERLLPAIGSFDFDGANPLEETDVDAQHFGVGVLPLLALLATAEEVASFHRRRGISSDVSWRSLSDLGQQAWVHRRTYGTFGLHTFSWMRIAWSGALYWLGRLQFNLQQIDGEWVISTHIPSTGALTPAAVDDSFRWARGFFADHFGDLQTTDFYCSSWLLDPELAVVLPAESNMARFQQRWRLYGEPMRGDADVLFFTFFRRGDVDLASLPQETTLQRAIVARLERGDHWESWQGRIPQASLKALS